MPNIEIDKRVFSHEYTMSNLHSHSYYEFYFLTEGTRQYFFKNAMYHISAPTLILIPPHTMHKTEGGPFTRYTLIAYPSQLNGFQAKTLEKYKLHLIRPTEKETAELIQILEEADKIQNEADKSDITDALFSYFVYQVSKLDLKYEDRAATQTKAVPAAILKVFSYLNTHYRENLTLDDLSQKFFVSKSTLNYNFKRHLLCTPMEYLTNVRLSKAKELLLNSKKSITVIAKECGFSSPNYFGLVFKRKEHVSPALYRKIES